MSVFKAATLLESMVKTMHPTTVSGKSGYAIVDTTNEKILFYEDSQAAVNGAAGIYFAFKWHILNNEVQITPIN